MPSATPLPTGCDPGRHTKDDATYRSQHLNGTGPAGAPTYTERPNLLRLKAYKKPSGAERHPLSEALRAHPSPDHHPLREALRAHPPTRRPTTTP
ncbi:hypothetical protein ABZ348_04075 [Streptomyces sp. NPDC005963]|uniref:hypothetical protein n=1 Tax=Streptomyces sp. NPDC005963 TaxID=3156721 RepID=UPI0033F48164